MGGRVFDNAELIKKEHINNTLKNYILELQTIFPKTNNIFNNFVIVGSCGKVPYSGDIDLAFNITYLQPIKTKLNLFDININEFNKKLNKYIKRAKTSTIEQLELKTLLYFIAEQINLKSNLIIMNTKKINISSLFSSFYQYDHNNQKINKQVQIDLMFGNIDWLKFSYYSKSYKQNIKGLHRTQLMLSLFNHGDYTFSHLYGVKNKETQKIEVTTVLDAINLLSTLYNVNFSKKILQDYFELHNFIKINLPKKDYYSVIDIYLSIIDKTRADVPYDLQQYWIENAKRLNLTGKFLPKNSRLIWVELRVEIEY